ncbi:MAG: hypothetical protein MJ033_02850 [Victivallaceae bacterium]|nr:hypothetical protein [Victivallaceae bacterium]
MENNQNISAEDLKRIFIGKIREFYNEENRLLADDLCERALVFRIGCRLYNAFAGCSVFCEYNKAHGENGTTSKEIPGQIHTYPDILIFSATETGSSANKIVVEVKKSNNANSWSSDIDKLTWFTAPRYKYRYLIGYHLILAENIFILCLYERGHLTSITKHIKRGTTWGFQTAPPSPIGYTCFKDLMRAEYE